MRTILFFIFLFLSTNSLRGQALDLKQKIDYEVRNQTLEDALQYFKQVAQISLGYNPDKLPTQPKYSLSLKQTPIEQVLNTLLRGTKLTYQVTGQQIIIYPRQTHNTQPSRSFKEMVIQGTILDQQSQEPVSFAHIGVLHKTLGSVANEQGKFRIILPRSSMKDSLLISCIGYEDTLLSVRQAMAEEVIYLRPVSIELEQIYIDGKREKFDALAVVQEAVAKIPQNYPQHSTLFKAYYRELTKTNGQYTKFADAACEIYYQGYGQDFNRVKSQRQYLDYSALKLGKPVVPFSRPISQYPMAEDALKVQEARISDDLQRYYTDERYQGSFSFLEAQEIPGGPLRLTSYDLVKQIAFLLNEKEMKKFKFALADYTKYQGRYVYVISFRPKFRILNSAVEEGTLFIDEKTGTILKFDFHLQPGKKNPMKVWIAVAVKEKERKKFKFKNNRNKRKVWITDYHIEVEYSLQQNKAYLKRIEETVEHLNKGDLFGDIIQQTRCDLIIHDLDTHQVQPFHPAEIYRTIVTNGLYQYPLSYDSEFWKTYPAILMDPIIEEALQDLEQTHSLQEQFARKFQQDSTLTPPVASVIPDTLFVHQDTLVDPYAWLRNSEDTLVAHYLKQENAYTHNYMIPWRKVQRELYYEMVDKTERYEESIPLKIGNYYYGDRYEADKPYEIYYRKKDSLNNQEEILLDVNKLAQGHEYYSVDDWQISPNHHILSYMENTTGGIENVVRFKDLSKQKLLNDSLVNVGSLVWANDNKTLFYTQIDSTLREYRLFKHKLGSNSKRDVLVFQEEDRKFHIYVYPSTSKKYIYLISTSKEENEVRILQADQPLGEWQLIEPRKPGHKYYLYDHQDHFYISSNKNQADFELYKTPSHQLSLENWKQTLSYSRDTLMKNFTIIGDYLVMLEHVQMKPQLRITHLPSQETHYLASDSTEIYQLGILRAHEGETHILRYIFNSPIHPYKVYAYNMKTRVRTLVKEQKVKAYQSSSYRTERIFAKAKDGTQIPITLVYNPTDSLATQRKLHLIAYGAYGYTYPLGFQIGNLPFINRGGIIAYAHVRGGGEFGHCWYEAGKKLNKKNTFEDFVACAEHLIEQGYGTKGALIASGGSAGGLLMGVVLNERPELFKAIILDVPFVDVVYTMLDNSLPLTTSEYQEWGNPQDSTYYHYIKSYAPYQNVRKQAYPHLLFRSGFFDDQVGYWEAAKMVAKLRIHKLDDHVLLLETNMQAGHMGASGRYASFKRRSFMDSFIQSVFEKE